MLCVVLMASALDMRQKNINDIKKRKDFLYSDVTMKTGEEAASLAYEQIQQEILSWASERSKKKNIANVSAEDLNRVVDTIMVRRAEMFRVFAYVRKIKLVSSFKEWKLTLDPLLDVEKGEDEENSDTVTIEPPIDLNLSEHKQEESDSLTSKSEKVSTKDAVVANDSIRALLFMNYLGR